VPPAECRNRLGVNRHMSTHGEYHSDDGPSVEPVDGPHPTLDGPGTVCPSTETVEANGQRSADGSGTTAAGEDACGPDPLIPARMLNEFAYCPRLAYLEWVQGEFAHTADTLDGQFQHRRVDKPGGDLPDADEPRASCPSGLRPAAGEGREERSESGVRDSQLESGQDGRAPVPTIHARSVYLSAINEGLTAIIDLIEDDPAPPPAANPLSPAVPPRAVQPVDYKRGSVPDRPERIQLCAQGLILRENGYRCEEGVIYYAASKTRVTIRFDETLCARTRELASQFRASVARGQLPSPLQDSPKCPRCSLVGICLPDETNLLRHGPRASSPPVVQAFQPDLATRHNPPDCVAQAGGMRHAEQAGPFDSAQDQQPDVPVRPLVPARDDARPLYVQDQGGYVGKKGDCITVSCRQGTSSDGRGTTVAEIRLAELAHVALFGNVQISAQALASLLDAQIPVTHFSHGGWFRGATLGLPSRNIDLRRRQFERAANPSDALSLARRFVAAKIENQRTLLRRNGNPPPSALDEMKTLAGRATTCESLASLLGLEGNAARLYFQHFATMLRPPANGPRASLPALGPDDSAKSGQDGRAPGPRAACPAKLCEDGFRPPTQPETQEALESAAMQSAFSFSFQKRNRRPPADPVNALLSYAYAILTKDFTIACWVAGLDPFQGFYHQPRFGRPALALDLMEEFRPIIADSVVLTAINTGMVRPDDFLRRGGAVSLKPEGRRRFLQAYERRMDSLVTHPVFEYQISYRRVLEVQARLLGRWLLGEIAEYPSFLVR